jgi:hypothetical protein
MGASHHVPSERRPKPCLLAPPPKLRIHTTNPEPNSHYEPKLGPVVMSRAGQRVRLTILPSDDMRVATSLPARDAQRPL